MEDLVTTVVNALSARNKSRPTKAAVRRLLTAPAASFRGKLLAPGNTKLGSKIHVWGVPAVNSCPGRTALCADRCYATKYMYTYPAAITSRHKKFVLANRPDFAEMMAAEVLAKKAEVVRVHDSGDLFSVAYAEAWLAVMAACPGTRFFLFTRSWRVGGVDDVVARMARLANARVWYSVDRETGWPRTVPARVRLAYMQVEAGDVPPRQVDLVFRDYRARRTPAKRVGGALVCPYENGATRDPKAGTSGGLDCSACGLCWGALGGAKDPRSHHGLRVRGTGRTPLAVLPATV